MQKHQRINENSANKIQKDNMSLFEVLCVWKQFSFIHRINVFYQIIKI